jgi:hypothetical protein
MVAVANSVLLNSDGSGRCAKPICRLLYTAYCTLVGLNRVCQDCADMLIVNLWRTPKAFKGKGQAVAQLFRLVGISASFREFSLYQRGTVLAKGDV